MNFGRIPSHLRQGVLHQPKAFAYLSTIDFLLSIAWFRTANERRNDDQFTYANVEFDPEAKPVLACEIESHFLLVDLIQVEAS